MDFLALLLLRMVRRLYICKASFMSGFFISHAVRSDTLTSALPLLNT
jgi:hypothetical protein